MNRPDAHRNNAVLAIYDNLSIILTIGYISDPLIYVYLTKYYRDIIINKFCPCRKQQPVQSQGGMSNKQSASVLLTAIPLNNSKHDQGGVQGGMECKPLEDVGDEEISR